MDRFCPTDSELLNFLLMFIAKEPLCDDGFITEHDVYKQEPWETYRHGGQDNGDTSIYRYFITPMQKKKGRYSRTVGKNIGTWRQQDKGKDVIMSRNNQSKCLIMGRKKSLCYENTKCYPDDRDDGKWLMKEYVLCDSKVLRKLKNSEFGDYVICAIKKKSKKNSSVTTVMDYSAQEKVDTEVTSGVNPVDEPLMIIPIDVVEPMVEYDDPEVQIEEAASEENGVLELTTFSQIQESMIPDSENAMSENNDPEIMDTSAENTSDIVLDENQTQYQPAAQQEESETFCETEQSSLISGLVDATLDHATMTDRLAVRMSHILMLDW